MELELALRLGSPAIGAAPNPELVANGTFDTDTTGWTAANSAVLSVVGGAMRVEDSAAAFGYAHTAVQLTNGVSYTLTLTKSSNNANSVVGMATAPGNTTFSTTGNSLTFTATSTATWYISAFAGGNVIGNRTDYDNISLKRT